MATTQRDGLTRSGRIAEFLWPISRKAIGRGPCGVMLWPLLAFH